MRKHGKTWWGQRFLAALETFTNPARLARGRGYATDNRIKKWSLVQGTAKASVRGNINPYFGVYKEPTYSVKVNITTLSSAQWQQIIARLSQKASFISRLLLNEIPENIENVFDEVGLHFLPSGHKDFIVECSCPDSEVPCKHIAGVCFRLANLFDQDPFLLFEMRGLSPQELQRELLKSPLGKVLATAKMAQSHALIEAESFYQRPQQIDLPTQVNVTQFWQGEKAIPKYFEPPQQAMIPALVIKKGGDFPPFWEKSSSFIELMEEFYTRMRKASLKEL
jgi:uncharacterized Zn finger protein